MPTCIVLWFDWRCVALTEDGQPVSPEAEEVQKTTLRKLQDLWNLLHVPRDYDVSDKFLKKPTCQIVPVLVISSALEDKRVLVKVIEALNPVVFKHKQDFTAVFVLYESQLCSAQRLSELRNAAISASHEYMKNLEKRYGKLISQLPTISLNAPTNPMISYLTSHLSNSFTPGIAISAAIGCLKLECKFKIAFLQELRGSFAEAVGSYVQLFNVLLEGGLYPPNIPPSHPKSQDLEARLQRPPLWVQPDQPPLDEVMGPTERVSLLAFLTWKLTLLLSDGGKRAGDFHIYLTKFRGDCAPVDVLNLLTLSALHRSIASLFRNKSYTAYPTLVQEQWHSPELHLACAMRAVREMNKLLMTTQWQEYINSDCSPDQVVVPKVIGRLPHLRGEHKSCGLFFNPDVDFGEQRIWMPFGVSCRTLSQGKIIASAMALASQISQFALNRNYCGGVIAHYQAAQCLASAGWYGFAAKVLCLLILPIISRTTGEDTSGADAKTNEDDEPLVKCADDHAISRSDTLSNESASSSLPAPASVLIIPPLCPKSMRTLIQPWWALRHGRPLSGKYQSVKDGLSYSASTPVLARAFPAISVNAVALLVACLLRCCDLPVPETLLDFTGPLQDAGSSALPKTVLQVYIDSVFRQHLASISRALTVRDGGRYVQALSQFISEFTSRSFALSSTSLLKPPSPSAMFKIVCLLRGLLDADVETSSETDMRWNLVELQMCMGVLANISQHLTKGVQKPPDLIPIRYMNRVLGISSVQGVVEIKFSKASSDKLLRFEAFDGKSSTPFLSIDRNLMIDCDENHFSFNCYCSAFELCCARLTWESDEESEIEEYTRFLPGELLKHHTAYSAISALTASGIDPIVINPPMIGIQGFSVAPVENNLEVRFLWESSHCTSARPHVLTGLTNRPFLRLEFLTDAQVYTPFVYADQLDWSVYCKRDSSVDGPAPRLDFATFILDETTGVREEVSHKDALLRLTSEHAPIWIALESKVSYVDEMEVICDIKFDNRDRITVKTQNSLKMKVPFVWSLTRVTEDPTRVLNHRPFLPEIEFSVVNPTESVIGELDLLSFDAPKGFYQGHSVSGSSLSDGQLSCDLQPPEGASGDGQGYITMWHSPDDFDLVNVVKPVCSLTNTRFHRAADPLVTIQPISDSSVQIQLHQLIEAILTFGGANDYFTDLNNRLLQLVKKGLGCTDAQAAESRTNSGLVLRVTVDTNTVLINFSTSLLLSVMVSYCDLSYGTLVSKHGIMIPRPLAFTKYPVSVYMKIGSLQGTCGVPIPVSYFIVNKSYKVIHTKYALTEDKMLIQGIIADEVILRPMTTTKLSFEMISLASGPAEIPKLHVQVVSEELPLWPILHPFLINTENSVSWPKVASASTRTAVTVEFYSAEST